MGWDWTSPVDKPHFQLANWGIQQVKTLVQQNSPQHKLIQVTMCQNRVKRYRKKVKEMML